MKALNKKGNISGLRAFVMGIGAIAITLTIVLIIVAEMSTNSASCPTTHSSFNVTSGLCYNSSGHTTAELTGAGSALTTLTTKLGTVPNWIGILIVVALATLVLSYFYMKR